MAYWLKIHLLMQGAWVRSLVGEDPTYCRATKPLYHNYGHALEPFSVTREATSIKVWLNKLQYIHNNQREDVYPAHLEHSFFLYISSGTLIGR